MLFSQKNFVEDRRGSGHVRQLINMGFCLTEFHIVYTYIRSESQFGKKGAYY